MKFWDRVKKDLQIAMKEGGELFKEGTDAIRSEARRMAEKGAASMSAEAQNMMREGVKTAKKGAATLTTEARRMTHIANLRYQLFRLNQKAQDKFAEIGGQIYETAAKNQKGVRLHEKVRKLILEAKQIEGLIKKLKSEIDRLSKGEKE
jgi:hypothetical protein